MFEWVKKDLEKISSHQHKYYLIISIIYMIVLNVGSLSIGITLLCFSVKDFWWVTLMFVSMGLMGDIIFLFIIKSRLKYYRLALAREKKEQENKIKENNYETKNSL